MHPSSAQHGRNLLGRATEIALAAAAVRTRERILPDVHGPATAPRCGHGDDDDVLAADDLFLDVLFFQNVAADARRVANDPPKFGDHAVGVG